MAWADEARAAADHPRSRGEYPLGILAAVTDYGSSPLSRGIRDPTVLAGPSRRIIPALAGNTQANDVMIVAAADHPRSRGEYRGS